MGRKYWWEMWREILVGNFDGKFGGKYWRENIGGKYWWEILAGNIGGKYLGPISGNFISVALLLVTK